MAFSFRKIISNINYFKKPDDHCNKVDVDPNTNIRHNINEAEICDAEIVEFEHTEPDSTNRNILEIDSTKNVAKKSSFSDSDLPKTAKRRSKKLKLDVKKANQSLDENLKTHPDTDNPENTPKHIFTESKSAEAFAERLKMFDFNMSFNIDSDDQSSPYEENEDLQSLGYSDDISVASQDLSGEIKMCRKVQSVTPESFADVEVVEIEDHRLSLLLNYQNAFSKIDNIIRNLLTEFQFHIDVNKIFTTRSNGCTEHVNDDMIVLKTIEETPNESWHLVINKEDSVTKTKLRNQLVTIQNTIEQFINSNLKNQRKNQTKNRKRICKNKKKFKHYDFPDYREALLNLFSTNDQDMSMEEKCHCNCHHNDSQTDSGNPQTEDRSMSITSSLGNFSLDSSTLTAYSESLDLIISYNSFQDTSLYSTLLQKAAIERITFYVQVHSIQLKSEPSDDYESKNIISFHCPACNTMETDENSLLKHIFTQYHCEKLHFLYKTAYIKKCVQLGKEIQPSTVLNPMKLYRDDNKIVCFGDAMYACSLCFEKLIVGESVLMAHCMEAEHLERKEKLNEMLA